MLCTAVGLQVPLRATWQAHHSLGGQLLGTPHAGKHARDPRLTTGLHDEKLLIYADPVVVTHGLGHCLACSAWLTQQPSTALMSWKLTIDCHEQQLLGLDDLKQAVQVIEDAYNHLCLCELGIGVVSVGAVVDDAIHVQVQIVYHWDLRTVCGLIQ